MPGGEMVIDHRGDDPAYAQPFLGSIDHCIRIVDHQGYRHADGRSVIANKAAAVDAVVEQLVSHDLTALSENGSITPDVARETLTDAIA